MTSPSRSRREPSLAAPARPGYAGRVRIHHLDCGTLCPFGQRWIDGEGSITGRGTLCCHVLLIESDDGLVLVDTGFGVRDVTDPAERLGRIFTMLGQPKLRLEQTALHQVKALGFDPADVRHIVLTHGDLDHGGGIPDFPSATVHIFADEHRAITEPVGVEKVRYRPMRMNEPVNWASHAVDGERWMGFDAVRALPGVDPEVLMLPLPGHSRGHVAVAVRTSERWLVHAGDAYFHHGQMQEPPHIPPGLGLFQRLVDHDTPARIANQERLRQLSLTHRGEAQVFCAHDPVELAAMQAGQQGSGSD